MTQCVVKNRIVERKTLALIGIIGFIFAAGAAEILAQEAPKAHVSDATIPCYATAQSLKSLSNLHDGAWVKTAGFYVPGDGGGALYHIRKLSVKSPQDNKEFHPNGADVIDLKNGLAAILVESEGVH